MPHADHAHEHTGTRRPAGALETEVMAALWANQEPMTARQVHQALGRGLAYKTVLTVLGRLHAKELLEREQVGRAHAYRPRQAPPQDAAHQMTTALSRGSDRAAVLEHFVETLDPADEAALRALLDARE
ncbi:BlaI/MecI/CopY family transcriptional regulator [Streptomyces silvisoli]|uniref:BlaI/MecI/CopY family transcriptional regulator n=1 Tax=Streptomyces silvisoli TaxID=3034235 RepID=A0ABT5ZP48_9ACTN|nr:BlaI/MecI/CopY family transcriptional regulator [Streptomyces silvisoli]MDF3291601.1 BlaI/MecI/CopY family transcriptional regulator [Streptomyces silvisoli]